MVMVGSSSLTRFAQLLTIRLVLMICTIQLLSVLFCCGGSSSSNNVTNCPEQERQALLGMIQDTGGVDFGNPDFLTDSWVRGTTNCCQWYGIACDRRTGHLVRINLTNYLTYPFFHSNLTPKLKLNNSLLALSKHLRYLDLSGNDIDTDTDDGGGIPGFIGSFQNLRYLNLSNTFIGHIGVSIEVPHQLGNLSRLRTLSLMGSDGSPPFQMDDPRWLSRLTSLQHIELGLDSFGPELVQALTMLPSIRVIRVTAATTSGGGGSIPSSLNPLNFTNLSVLDISGIEIDENSTTVLPRWLSSLTRLRYLRLSNSNMREEVVDFWNLSYSSSLEVLDLSSNQLQGSIPADTLGSMSMLRELDLSGNNLSGSVPRSLGRLSRLEFLDLSNNNLSGSVPQSLGRLSRLEFLDLSNNSLTGSLTEAHFANLYSLKHLGMADMNSPIALDVSSAWQPPFHLQYALLSGGCQIVGGRFPRWLRSQLQSLSTLDISNTRIQDSVPRWFWTDNSSIVTLNLSNNAIFGSLPTTLHPPLLQYVDLSSNRLYGPLPQHIISLNLMILDLSNNSFSGPISNIGTSNLDYLLLSKNNLTGEVPAFICQARLSILDLSQNHLTGELPDCHQPVFFQAFIFDLSYNNLSGRIPDNLGSGDCKLESLYLNNNNFSGEVPSSLTNCRFLSVLDLAYNECTGNIAIWLDNSRDSISNLRILSLRSNKFYGSLPPMLYQVEKLEILDLSFNNLSGAIPPSFGSFQSMMTSDASDLIWNGAIFEDRVLLWMKGMEQRYDKLLKFLVAIDLSHNDLSGTIPEQLANLILLQSLNLSNNHLTGEITTKIGRMQQLESLDLSYNRLSGPIPPSLANLSSLGDLDLSYNNLSGRIPMGGQLNTFQDPSVYRGNPFLITEEHGGDTTTEGASFGENTDEGIDEKFWLYISIAPGFVVGIWVVLGTLLLKKTWRYAYFRAVDAMHDKILCRQS